MCIALPGKIVAIDGSQGKVNFKGNLVDVNLGRIKAELGDYVLVHAGCAIEVMLADMAEEIIAIFEELDSLQ